MRGELQQCEVPRVGRLGAERMDGDAFALQPRKRGRHLGGRGRVGEVAQCKVGDEEKFAAVAGRGVEQLFRLAEARREIGHTLRHGHRAERLLDAGGGDRKGIERDRLMAPGQRHDVDSSRRNARTEHRAAQSEGRFQAGRRLVPRGHAGGRVEQHHAMRRRRRRREGVGPDGNLPARGAGHRDHHRRQRERAEGHHEILQPGPQSALRLEHAAEHVHRAPLDLPPTPAEEEIDDDRDRRHRKGPKHGRRREFHRVVLWEEVQRVAARRARR